MNQPLAAPPPASTADIPPAGGAAPAATADAVLIVEDNAAVALVYRRLLERSGRPALVARDGLEALDILAEYPVGCVLVDKGLPGMSGVELIGRIRSADPSAGLRIIMVTGDDQPEQRAVGLDAGADDYLVKPVLADELIARVNAQFRTRDALRTAVMSAPSSWAPAAAWVAERILRRDFAIHVQPIVSLHDQRAAGYEALTRFADGTRPDIGFAWARAVGRGPELGLAAIEAAIGQADGLPADAFLSVNAGPETVIDERLPALVARSPRPLVIEITEHDRIVDYEALRASLEPLRARVRVAIDDTGAGYSSLAHVLELRPDLMKIDAASVRGLDRDAGRRALISGLAVFAAGIGAMLVAEGVETAVELAAVRDLGIPLAQGYLLGRPVPLVTAA